MVQRAIAGMATAALLLGACSGNDRVDEGGGGQVAVSDAPSSSDDGAADAAAAAVTGTNEQPDDAAATTDQAAAGSSGSAGDGSPPSGTSGSSAGSGGATTPSPVTPAPEDVVADYFAEGARGVTATEVHIGFEYLESAQEANQAIYGADVSRGDPDFFHKVMREWINATGGLGGRTLVPHFYVYDAQDARTSATVEQEACTYFTQDVEIFAVVSSIGHTDNFRQCLADAGVAQIAAEGLGTSDDGVFQAFPNYLEVNTFSISTLGRLWVTGLADMGYFEPEAVDGETRLGFVAFDDPRSRRMVSDHLEPTLASVGQDIDEIVYLDPPASTAETGALAAQINNAVLQFKTANIDHVMVSDVSGTVTLLWMRGAEAQAYYPQYGMTSQNAGQVLAGLVNHDVLVGAMSVGWIPFVDVLPEDDDIIWSGRKTCRDILNAQDAGIDHNSRNVERGAMVYCDAYRFLRAALDAAPKPIAGPADLRAGGTSLGASYDGGYTYDMVYGPGKRWGATSYRQVLWFEDCGCFKYQTQPIAFKG